MTAVSAQHGREGGLIDFDRQYEKSFQQRAIDFTSPSFDSYSLMRSVYRVFDDAFLTILQLNANRFQIISDFIR